MKEALSKPKPTGKKKGKAKFASLLNFVVPRSQLVPSLMGTSMPEALTSSATSPAIPEVESPACQPTCELAKELKLLADGLLGSVPEALESDDITQLV